METFNKTMHSMLDSTIWLENSDTRVVWVTMLLMANKDGEVYGALPGLAKRANVPIDVCEEALVRLSSPDKYSRTKTDGGKRVREIDGGWLIINYTKYRGETTEEKRKRWSRDTSQRYREKQKLRDHCVTEVTENRVTHCHSDRNDSHETKIISEEDKRSLRAPRARVTRELELQQRTSVPKMEELQLKMVKVKNPAPGAEVWKAYAKSYQQVYGVPPVRNAKTNSQCMMLVERLGLDAARGVASYYPTSKNSYDRSRGHSLGVLLADCEKHHTIWKTGNQITQTQAREGDRLETARSVVDAVIEKMGDDPDRPGKSEPLQVGKCSASEKMKGHET